MKIIVVLIISVLLGINFTQAQNKPASIKIEEKEVPDAIINKEGIADGFPIENWNKFMLNDSQLRFVAVYQQMNPSSGNVLQKRQRFTSDGRLTSISEYRGNKKEDAEVYLGTGGVDPKFLEKFNKKIKEFNFISFEGFTFFPGNQNQSIETHRLVLKDKSGRKVTAYYDRAGNEIDMSKYPIRLLESQELD